MACRGTALLFTMKQNTNGQYDSCATQVRDYSQLTQFSLCQQQNMLRRLCNETKDMVRASYKVVEQLAK
jgi:hypothetical protein